MRASVVLVLAAACGASGDPVTFDPCALTTSADASAAQLAGIDAALASWNALGLHVTRVDSAGDVPIAFRADPAATEYGLYDDGAIYVNTSVTAPQALAVTIAHELGHAFGLVHIASTTRASVMNPGNLSIAPTSVDAATVAARWGSCD